MRRIVKERSLGIALVFLFLASWALQAWTGWHQFEAEQSAHGSSAALFGNDGYVWSFLQATMENWQSEFLQLLTFVVLTAVLIYKGSPESRDGQDEMLAAIHRIEARLDDITQPGRPSPSTPPGPS